MTDSLQDLLRISTGPLGPARYADFGTDSGVLGELTRVLWERNGFFLFNAGLQIFRAGPDGLGPDLAQWNDRAGWKQTYGLLADDLFCFAQDLFGVQFAITGNQRVVAFDPETGHRRELGASLQDWAAWLLAEPDLHGTRAFATAWQDSHGPLQPDQRLIPSRFFVLGGTYNHSNLTAHDATECMIIRGPFAQQVHDLPPGATVRIGANSDDQQPARTEMQLSADYSQLHLYDEQARIVDVPEGWGEQLVENKIAADEDEPTLVGLGTYRSGPVPVTVEVLQYSPANHDLADWDHVAEASIHTPSGILVIDAPTGNNGEKIHLTPGTYRVRHHTAGRDTLSEDELQGDDYYRIQLWPEEPYRELEKLKP